ncbi:MAG: hypothetical protein WDO56_15530 [Gammaproteobacteria bacterium]
MKRFIAVCSLALGAWTPGATHGPVAMSDFERELAALDVAIAAAGSPSSGEATPAERTAAIAELIDRRASLTGNARDLERASVALDNALALAGPAEELLLLTADLKLRTHRVHEAARVLASIPEPADPVRAATLRADIDVQDGDYVSAKHAYESLVESRPTWDRIARLAYLESILGNPDRADSLYASAADQLTVKDMRQFAWLELQRGLLEFRRGRFEPALAHYEHADRAYSGYWMTQDYLAELLAARAGTQTSSVRADSLEQVVLRAFGKRAGERASERASERDSELRRAAELYERLLATSAQPPAEQALGDVYALLGDAARSRAHHERALSGYLESVQRGETQYLHHLAGYYADVAMNGAEAVRWARKDLEMRAGYAAHDALAWALFRNGEIESARQEMEPALASGVRDAHMLFHAAMIDLASGHRDKGQRLLREASAVNPLYPTFHVHR